MIPQVDALGRIYSAASGTPVSWNGGLGFDSVGRLCTTTALLATDQRIGGRRVDLLGRLVVAPMSGSLTHNGGWPALSNSATPRTTDTAPVAGDSFISGGIRVQAAGALCLSTSAPPNTPFLALMSLGHELVVGANPSGNRLGYRRDEWGDFTPHDVPNLHRVFTGVGNNRLVVQADGDFSDLVLTNLHVQRLSPVEIFDFGPPNNVVFDGVQTDFIWIVPGFDFVLGETYEVKLS